jgi:hypothetical protein
MKPHRGLSQDQKKAHQKNPRVYKARNGELWKLPLEENSHTEVSDYSEFLENLKLQYLSSSISKYAIQQRRQNRFE